MTSQLSDMTSSSNFLTLFVSLMKLVTGPSFMSRSSLVLKLWQFSFIKDWPEIRKSEILPSEFCSISGDWGKLVMPNLARVPLIKCYWILQNSRVTPFTVSELLRENQQGRGESKITPVTQIKVKQNEKILIQISSFYLFINAIVLQLNVLTFLQLKYNINVIVVANQNVEM